MTRKLNRITILTILAEELIRLAKDGSVTNEQFNEQAEKMLQQVLGPMKIKAPKKKVRRGIGSY